jgi:tRNA pseudouridine38-40 synthase
VRTVLTARCWAEDEIVNIEVEADAFLQHMMRRLAATLVAVGFGRLGVGDFAAIIQARDVGRVAGMAPPHGLCLVAVRYDARVPDWALPALELWQKESCSK